MQMLYFYNKFLDMIGLSLNYWVDIIRIKDQNRRFFMKNIVIKCQGYEFEAELNGSNTAEEIAKILPVENNANIWGEEIYFSIPAYLDLEEGCKQEVEVGELGYWPVGNAFCIFFGPTPVSVSEKPRAYSEVNVFGKITKGLENLYQVKNGVPIKVELKK